MLNIWAGRHGPEIVPCPAWVQEIVVGGLQLASHPASVFPHSTLDLSSRPSPQGFYSVAVVLRWNIMTERYSLRAHECWT